ncbi:hypothetical protein CDL15_Pgr013353 [Punica granatum]|uniref:Uncharacterized protein n=1 Tax=Punica granatum TaxID=22663 RepID=A0A218WA35_PUNGR|nr:hypothetical protein CDL15_Pgr013353 [Punica granatum]
MTRSGPTSLAGVTHYGDLEANFNQGGPSVRRLPRLCWRELQPGMPQCTSLGNAYRGWMMSEVVSVKALNANALGVPPCRAPSLSKYKGGGTRGVLGKA